MTPYVLAFDPGLLTGLALVDTAAAEVLYSGEHEWQELGMKTGELLMAYQGQVTVVGEKFTVTQQTAKNSPAQWSMEIIGQMRWITWRCGAVFHEPLQKPVDAKAFARNDKLKALGMWHKGGEGHANDALRHALLWMVRQGFHDPRMMV